ncbi:CDP-alcohol phosphatidyltransferase family protein [Photobacterium atrarenae]|uniref:CDP-diacylglycerol--glycerol-3-phosphate 3-phosphatidyltransferase n=1 Tax=Photobacterium atrarenae TaxID=865757 RepID=A0ABY5GMM3_9GAMM|nr:CDP-alcohol phosphatidyltransferase family protein [Photobacterium atrarenae]UTV30345.1 CDP-alcohol phosphatidyltransferase family protein [Photobacterium atrarenae]
MLTTLRMFLAVPIYFFILERNFTTVLWIIAIAGLSDGLDGWLARKLKALSHYGAIVDPLSDKAMLLCAYIAFVQIELLPLWVFAMIVIRDIIILLGAALFYLCFGPYRLAPSLWGKGCTLALIVLALLIISQQLLPQIPEQLISVGLMAVIFLITISGTHYIYNWAAKAHMLWKSPPPHR